MLQVWALLTVVFLVRAFAWALLSNPPSTDAGGVVPIVVDVNSAGLGELAALPGIGPERARRILLDRVRQGPFRAVDDLVRVDGIGIETVAGLRPHAIAVPPRSR